MWFRRTLLCLFAVAFMFLSSFAQGVSISPTMVFVDERQQFGSYLVLNGSDQTQEVTVDFVFGYPDIKSGTMQMIYENKEMEGKYSINESVRAFPKRFTLAPQQRQVVRIRVQPGRELDDGVYWTRIKTTSNPQSPPIGAEVDDDVTASINFRVEQVTTILFKKGDLSTGLRVDRFNADLTDNNLIITTKVSRSGNAPYIGSLQLDVKNSNGEVVLQDRTNIAVYFDYVSTFTTGLNTLPNGTYTAEATFLTERSDVASEHLVQSTPITRTINFEIQ